MNLKKFGGTLCCLLAAFFWGTTFVVQDRAAEHIPAFTYLALRSFVGATALLLVILVRGRLRGHRKEAVTATSESKRLLLAGGIGCGLFLCAASALQQLGIAGNAGSPGKDAFITALYIVFVPVLGLLLGKRAEPHVYVCVGVALLGLWLLCMNGSELTTADIQLMVCSLLFACQILLVDHVVERIDCIKLSCVQFFTVGIVSALLALLFEAPTLSGVLTGWWTVLYAGIFSSAVAYTLQIVGQQRTPAAVACLVLSLESVVAVIASMIVLRLYPTTPELIGMALIFLAVVVSQLRLFPKKTEKGARDTSKQS